MSLPEFEPTGLLPSGIHPATREELHERCVLGFPPGTTRTQVFSGLCQYQDALQGLGLHVTQWIDGSFVDGTRMNPGDADVVNFCDAAVLNAAVAAHSAARIQTMLNGRLFTRTVYATHAFLVVRFPSGQPRGRFLLSRASPLVGLVHNAFKVLWIDKGSISRTR